MKVLIVRVSTDVLVFARTGKLGLDRLWVHGSIDLRYSPQS